MADSRKIAFAQVRERSAHVNDGTYLTMWVVRPFAAPLAWLVLRAGLTARTVTYFGLAMACAIAGLIASGRPNAAVIGLALVLIWEVVDVIDGTMARALGSRDNFGGFIDYVSGLVLIALLPLALGVAAYRSPDHSLSQLLPQITLDPAWPVVAGAVTAMTGLLMRLVNRVILARFGDSYSTWGEAAVDDTPAGIAQIVVRNLEAIGGVRIFVLLGFALAGKLELGVAFYTLFGLLLLGVFVISTYRKYRHYVSYPPAR